MRQKSLTCVATFKEASVRTTHCEKKKEKKIIFSGSVGCFLHVDLPLLIPRLKLDPTRFSDLLHSYMGFPVKRPS